MELINPLNIAAAVFSKNLLEAHRTMHMIKQHPSVLEVSISLGRMPPNGTATEAYEALNWKNFSRRKTGAKR